MSDRPYKQASSSRLLVIAAGWLAVCAGCSTDAPTDTAQPANILDAVLGNDVAAVGEFVASGVNVNAPERDGTTLLMRAVHGATPEVVQALIDAGADVTAVNRYGVHALYLAARSGDAAAARALLAAGADPDAALPEGETVLMTAAKAGNTDVVRALLGDSGYSVTLDPASSGNAAAARATVPASRADPNAKEAWHGQTALMWAAAEDHPQIIRLLLEAGADPHERSAPFAAGAPAPGADTDTAASAQGELTALHFAARANALQSVRALLAGGADIDAADQLGNTPLHLAAAQGSAALVEVLAAGGANLAAENAVGATPLDVALRPPGAAPNEAAAALLARLQRAGS
jgi:hypothetical protein